MRYSVAMISIHETDNFSEWMARLRDKRARARINARIDRLAHGNAGDAMPVGGGVSEVRIHYGPGYRVYFTKIGLEIVLLLCGGDKSSQAADIAEAKALARRPLR